MPKIKLSYIIVLEPGAGIDYIQLNESRISGDKLPKAKGYTISGIAYIDTDKMSFDFEIKLSATGIQGLTSVGFMSDGWEADTKKAETKTLPDKSLLYTGRITIRESAYTVITFPFHEKALPLHKTTYEYKSYSMPKKVVNESPQPKTPRPPAKKSTSSKAATLKPAPAAKKDSKKNTPSTENTLQLLKNYVIKDLNAKKIIGNMQSTPDADHLNQPLMAPHNINTHDTSHGINFGIEGISAQKKIIDYKNVDLGLGVKNPNKGTAKRNNLQDPGGSVKVFYGTNRNKTTAKDLNKTYGNRMSEMAYGFCDISIPRGHILGNVERPGGFWIFKRKEHADSDVVIQHIEQVNQKAFTDIIGNALKKSTKKAALIFVHGYRVSFADAARQAGQIAWDVNFNGITGFFSWPSSGKYISYITDQRKARTSIAHLADYIEMLSTESGIEEFHFIAHSMGTLVLTMALNALAARPAFKDKMGSIKHIVLGAPDIDIDEFKLEILPSFKNVGNSRTVYASQRDLALGLSDLLIWRNPRLGSAGNDLFITNGIDTIDASNINIGWANHSYMFESKDLLQDLLLLLNEGLLPTARGLMEAWKTDLPYWVFKKS